MPLTKRSSSSTAAELEPRIEQVKRVRKNHRKPPDQDPEAQPPPKSATISAQWKVAGLPGGDVYYIPKFIESEKSREWYKQLNGLETWYHPKLKVYGKEITQSRSIAGISTTMYRIVPGSRYLAYAAAESVKAKYSGHQVDMNYGYPEIITEILGKVEEKLGVKFNNVMLNRYADGTEYIGRHRDTKQNNVIACLSVGAQRTFIFTPDKKCPGNPRPQSLVLQRGSLLIMQGDTQKNWKHEIPKEPSIKEGRISVTFRQLESV
ncbi:hypothetical protein K439DRAFT_1418431 [Ramaria rubella]|nr:hypothetical protein K439DRAFT_1418431 [Ramaria rubella]